MQLMRNLFFVLALLPFLVDGQCYYKYDEGERMPYNYDSTSTKKEVIDMNYTVDLITGRIIWGSEFGWHNGFYSDWQYNDKFYKVVDPTYIKSLYVGRGCDANDWSDKCAKKRLNSMKNVEEIWIRTGELPVPLNKLLRFKNLKRIVLDQIEGNEKFIKKAKKRFPNIIIQESNKEVYEIYSSSNFEYEYINFYWSRIFYKKKKKSLAFYLSISKDSIHYEKIQLIDSLLKLDSVFNKKANSIWKSSKIDTSNRFKSFSYWDIKHGHFQESVKKTKYHLPKEKGLIFLKSMIQFVHEELAKLEETQPTPSLRGTKQPLRTELR